MSNASSDPAKIVQQKLIEIAMGKDSDQIVADLYRNHTNHIKQHWQTIRFVPDSLRHDKAMGLSYALAVMMLATHFKEQGDPSLFEDLKAKHDS
jgi:hypothetical protein